jgi:hypothetical protein
MSRKNLFGKNLFGKNLFEESTPLANLCLKYCIGEWECKNNITGRKRGDRGCE